MRATYLVLLVVGFCFSGVSRAEDACADPSFGLFGSRTTRILDHAGESVERPCKLNPRPDGGAVATQALSKLNRGRVAFALRDTSSGGDWSGRYKSGSELPADWPSSCSPPDCGCEGAEDGATRLYTAACNLAAGREIGWAGGDGVLGTKAGADRVDELASAVLERARGMVKGEACAGSALKPEVSAAICGGSSSCAQSAAATSCYCGGTVDAACLGVLVITAEQVAARAGVNSVPVAVNSRGGRTSGTSAGSCAPADSCDGCDGPQNFLQCLAIWRQENLSAQITGYTATFDADAVARKARDFSAVCKTSAYYLQLGVCDALWSVASKGFQPGSFKDCGLGLRVANDAPCPLVRPLSDSDVQMRRTMFNMQMETP